MKSKNISIPHIYTNSCEFISIPGYQISWFAEKICFRRNVNSWVFCYNP